MGFWGDFIGDSKVGCAHRCGDYRPRHGGRSTVAQNPSGAENVDLLKPMWNNRRADADWLRKRGAPWRFAHGCRL